MSVDPISPSAVQHDTLGPGPEVRPTGAREGVFARGSSLAVLLLLTLSIFAPLASAGLWDPPELFGAEISRRVAVTMYGASHLAIQGANNLVPTVEEVGRGELPFLLSGLGFKLFGLHDWAGRLPLALSAWLGALSVFFVFRRLAGRRQATFTLLALASAPLFFLHARTLLGDALTAACSALAFSGLMLACFDATLKLPWRVLAFLGGVSGLGLGILTRGVWVGSFVPAFAVGATWLLLGPRLRSLGRFELRAVLGLLALVLAVAAAVWGTVAWFRASADDYWVALGSAVSPPRQFATHDLLIHQLGHAFFPWSAFVPVALGFALARPSKKSSKGESELALRSALILCAAVAIGVHTLLATRVGAFPFSATYALAGIVGFGVVEWDKKSAPAAAMCLAAFAILLFADFRHFPEKVLSAFVMAKPVLPESLERTTKLVFALVTAPVLLCGLLLAIERWPGLRRVASWAANNRFKHFRSWLLAGSLACAGFALSLGYYPVFAAQVSPMGVFETYEELSQPNEPIATTGKGGNASAYYGSFERRHFEQDNEALTWLLSGDGRRWLIAKADDLAKLNSRYRQDMPGKNLPVLDASSGDILLVSNQLRDGEVNRNPLLRFLPEAEPKPARTVTAAWGDKLRAIGWEIQRPEDGQQVSELAAGKSYRLHLYYEVLGRISQDWKTFVHIDGPSSRVNADHDTLKDKYPFRYWNKGDFIADEHVFELEPDVVPGEYTLFFGLYSGKTRLDLTTGGDKDDRVEGGTIIVR
jgi:4-amino-4-deoxy-L-arabinose transferase-like glycosyltransferase